MSQVKENKTTKSYFKDSTDEMYGSDPIKEVYDSKSTPSESIRKKRDFEKLPIFTPTKTADARGSIGQITYDGSYIYIKTNAGWKRSTLNTF